VTDIPHSDWMNQWQAMSRQYLDAWQGMARAPDMRPAFGAPAWPPQGFEQMAKLFPAAGGVQGGTIEHLVDSAKMYSAFMQSMLGATLQGNATPDLGDALRKGFASMGAGAAMPVGAFGHAAMPQWQGLTGQASDPFEQIRRAMGNLQMPSIDGFDVKSMLDMPAFGPDREKQENQQKSAIAWIDYQQHMARYNALMIKASQRGFELFEGKLLEREQPGRQIDSMRALYDLWVDAAEEGYAQIALSSEFREVYGAMVNAQMRVRSQVQKEVERVAGEFGMPTRSEINSIGERLQALRREVREQVAGDGLAGEVAALRRQVAELKEQVKRPPRAGIAEPAERNRRMPSQPVAASKPARPVVVKKVDSTPAKRKQFVRSIDDSGPAKRARPARTPAAAATPAKSKKRKGGKGKQRKQKAVAALATGSFASRIEKFATASRGPGNPRKKWKLAEKPADAKKKSGH